MKFSILTLGCKVNQAESYFLESNFIKYGWSVVPLSEKPDYSIINTCTVTAKSDYQSRQLIRRSLRSGADVIVTGCYAQLRPYEIRNIDSTIKIIGNNNKFNIINMLNNDYKSNTKSYKSHYYSKRTRAYLKVQDGCNFACTYCVVPKARGKSRSLEPSLLIKKAIELEEAGYNEIILTGIHLGLYGYDLKPKTKLSEILRLILEKTRIPRIRLSSLEVNEIDEEIIDILKDNRICNHLHIPLQSGDDNILRLMNRRYDTKRYISKIEYITKKVENIAIGTDIIVGFPGEGDKEFNNTKNVLNSIPIAYMHIFPYSKRPYTVAAEMKDQNNKNIKRERYNELNHLNIKKRNEYMRSYINKTLDVIVEEKGKENTIIGTSSNYLKIIIPSDSYRKGMLERVRISGIDNNKLIAHPI